MQGQCENYISLLLYLLMISSSCQFQLKQLILNINIYQRKYSDKGTMQDLMAQFSTHVYVQFVSIFLTFFYTEIIYFLQHSQ